MASYGGINGAAVAELTVLANILPVPVDGTAQLGLEADVPVNTVIDFVPTWQGTSQRAVVSSLTYQPGDILVQVSSTSATSTTIHTYHYDGLGRQTSIQDGSSQTYSTYDSLDRLIGSGNSTFTYAGDSSIRTSSSTNGITTNFQSDADGLISTKIGSQSTDYCIFEHQPLWSQSTFNPMPVFYSHNALNDVTGLIGSLPNGNTPFWGYQTKYQYDAFGIESQENIAYSMGIGAQSSISYQSVPLGTQIGGNGISDPGFSYKGEWRDQTGLSYLRARYLDPTIGRFTQADPAHADANAYAYCGSDPVNRTDPMGTDWQWQSDHWVYIFGTPNVRHPPQGFTPNWNAGNDIFSDASLPNLDAYFRAEADATRIQVPGFHPINEVVDAGEAIGHSIARDAHGFWYPADTTPEDAADQAAILEGIRNDPGALDNLGGKLFAQMNPVTATYNAFYGGTRSLIEDKRVLPITGAVVGLLAARAIPEVPGAPGVRVRLARPAFDMPARGGIEPGQYLFRGSTAGYPGNPSLQRIGVTPTSTNPAVATAFALEASQYGEGVVHIAESEGLPLIGGNVLGHLEAEVGVDLPPAQFTSRAGLTISAQQAREILGSMGIELPPSIASKAALDATVRSIEPMTTQQLTVFIERAQAAAHGAHP